MSSAVPRVQMLKSTPTMLPSRAHRVFSCCLGFAAQCITPQKRTDRLRTPEAAVRPTDRVLEIGAYASAPVARPGTDRTDLSLVYPFRLVLFVPVGLFRASGAFSLCPPASSGVVQVHNIMYL